MSDAQLEQPLQTPNLQAVPRVYANGISIGYTKTECVVTFLFANDPLVSVILSLPFTRVVSEQTAQVLADFEKRSGQKVPHPDEILPSLKPIDPPKSL